MENSLEKLTVEQKAQAYEERLERATIAYKDEDKHLKATLERIFPELKENKDERMRKIISDILLIDSDEIREILEANKVLMQDIEAWLEKQGEQISDKIVERARTEKQKVLLTETDGNANIDWNCRSLDDVKLLLEYGLGYIEKLEKQGEKKPVEWNEEDEKIVYRIISIMDTLNYQGMSKWLKSLKQRLGRNDHD